MKHHSLFIFILFIALFSFAQSGKTDSLKTLLTTAHDSSKAQIFYELARLNQRKEDSLFFSYCDSSMFWSKKTKQSKFLIKTPLLISSRYMRKSLFDSAEVYSKLSIKYALQFNDSVLLGDAFVNMGNINFYSGNHSKSLNWFYKALELREKINDTTGVGLVCSNIGEVYNITGNAEKSVEFNRRALDIFEKQQDDFRTSVALLNLGAAYSTLGKSDESLIFYEKSLAISRKLNDIVGIALTTTNIGHIYHDKGEYQKSIPYLQEGLKLREEIGDPYYISISKLVLASAQLNLKNKQEAVRLAKEAYHSGKETGAIQIVRDASSFLSKVYSDEKDFKNAYFYIQEYLSAKDSLLDEEKNKAIAELNAKYETNKKEQEIINLKKNEQIKELELAQKESEIKAKRNQQYALIMGICMLIFFSVFIYNRFKLSQKQKKIIENQKILVETKQKEILDSIHYAKRIQQALLTSESYMEKAIKRLKN